MRARFEGEKGHRLLLEILKRHELVEHDKELAQALATRGEVVDLTEGSVLIAQGDGSNHVFLVIAGECEILVHERPVARRGPGTSVGEMSFLCPESPRSATVKAIKPTVCLKLAEAELRSLAIEYPKIGMSLARTMANRLREREKFHTPPNPLPVLFIGSSVEGLPVATKIVTGLKHDKINPRLWSKPGLFSPGGVTIDELLREVRDADFAVFVFGPDDLIASRGEEYQAPRDNVIFELGLFMGLLSHDRTYIVMAAKSPIKIPTDLLGVTPITFIQHPGQDLDAALVSACDELRTVISKIGPR